MFTQPNIDPVALDLGQWNLPLIGSIHPQVHWYGLMYLIAFVGSGLMMHYRARKQAAFTPVQPAQVSDLMFYGALGVILGGRLGYCLFYKPELLMEFSASLPFWGALRFNEGGMSFHGGLLGVLLAIWWYGRKVGASFLQMGDFVAVATPFGLLCGRIGNFINGELWGRVTELPWGVVFRGAGPLPRHPSMLYEAFLEGLLLLLVLWVFSAKQRPLAAVSALFLLGYGAARFAVEFVREPDQHIGFIAFDWLTMGHLLSLPMIIAGLAMLLWAYRRQAA